MPSIDYSGDYNFWPQTEAVQLVQKRNQEGTLDVDHVDIAIARRMNVSETDINSLGGKLKGVSCVWHIPAALVPSHGSISAEDEILAADDELWIIKSASLIHKGQYASHWRCTAVKARKPV